MSIGWQSYITGLGDLKKAGIETELRERPLYEHSLKVGMAREKNVR